MIENIAIIGVGGVGGFFGGKLCRVQNNKASIKAHFVARGEHLRAIQAHGLTLITEKDGVLVCHPAAATDSVESLPQLDLCLICVKGFDLHPLLARIKGRIGENSIILPLLNGVDIYSRIRSILDKGVVLPACVYIGTHIEKPGVVSQKGGACKILFGADPAHPGFLPNELLELFGRASVPCDWRADVQTCIWEKFIFICSYGLVTAAYSKSIGEVLENGELKRKVSEIASETVAIAQGIGIDLPGNCGDAAVQKGYNFPYETKTSFQRDFEQQGKSDERDSFAGAILRYAAELNINTPTTAEILGRLERIKPEPNPQKP